MQERGGELVWFAAQSTKIILLTLHYQLGGGGGGPVMNGYSHLVESGDSNFMVVLNPFRNQAKL